MPADLCRLIYDSEIAVDSADARTPLAALPFRRAPRFGISGFGVSGIAISGNEQLTQRRLL